MNALSELLRHPLVLLLAGSVATALLVPKLSYWAKLKDTRLQKALALIEAGTTVDRHANALLTTLELFQKDSTGPAARLSDYRQEQRELRKTMMNLYLAFDRVAWWWYEDVQNQAILLGIAGRASLARIEVLTRTYEARLIETTDAINSLWTRFLRENYDPDVADNTTAMRETRAKASELERQRRVILGELAGILAKQARFWAHRSREHVVRP